MRAVSAVNAAGPADTVAGDPSWRTAAAIFLAAFAIRMAVPLLAPGMHYPDEVMQSLEQAHRLVFGYGLVPWEFRDGARSWLLPGLLAGPMWLGGVIAPSTDAYRYLAQALVAALSASSVVIGFYWGLRFSRWHGILAAVVLGTWFELVYFGARALGEVVASAFLFAGVFLCSGPLDIPRSSRRAFLAGLCLGGAFVFRFHLAPAIAVAVLWYCRADLRRDWLPLLAGASLPLVVLGLTDWATWSAPFGSIVTNFKANVVQGRSHLYGTSDTTWYVLQWLQQWGPASAVILVLAAWGARREPLPLITAAVIVLAHSAIAHKEYRFIYPAIPLVLVSAAFGSAELCRRLGARSSGHVGAGLVAIACLAWTATSAALATSPSMRSEWSRGRAGIELMTRAHEEAKCGLGLLAAWSWTGGYSSLHRPIPIYLLDWDHRTWAMRAFDAWILPKGFDQPTVFGYRLAACEVQNAEGVDALCLWVRSGGCDQTGAATEAQRVLNARGQ
jgi:hypothetical protein